jgi:hypothetical protein
MMTNLVLAHKTVTLIEGHEHRMFEYEIHSHARIMEHGLQLCYGVQLYLLHTLPCIS